MIIFFSIAFRYQDIAINRSELIKSVVDLVYDKMAGCLDIYFDYFMMVIIDGRSDFDLVLYFYRLLWLLLPSCLFFPLLLCSLVFFVNC